MGETMISKRSQAEKTPNFMIPSSSNVQNSQIHRNREQTASCLGTKGLWEMGIAFPLGDNDKIFRSTMFEGTLFANIKRQ